MPDRHDDGQERDPRPHHRHAGRRRRLHHQALHAAEAPLRPCASSSTSGARPPPAFLSTENEEVRFKNLLFDSVTELPTVPVIIDALRDRLLDSRDLGVLYVDVEQYSHIEDAYGWEVFDGLLRARRARRCAGCSGRSSRPRTSSRSTAPADRTSTSSRRSRRGTTRRPGSSARRARSRSLCAGRSTRPSAPASTSGSASSSATPSSGPNPQMRVERLVYRALRRGDRRSRRRRRSERQALPARDVQGDPAQAPDPDGLPADLRPEHDGALRPRGVDPRPAWTRPSRARSSSSSSPASTRRPGSSSSSASSPRRRHYSAHAGGPPLPQRRGGLDRGAVAARPAGPRAALERCGTRSSWR